MVSAQSLLNSETQVNADTAIYGKAPQLRSFPIIADSYYIKRSHITVRPIFFYISDLSRRTVKPAATQYNNVLSQNVELVKLF